MSIVTNALIQNVCQKCNLVSNGQSVDGTTARAALCDLNDEINKLNLEEYFGFSVRWTDLKAKELVKIGPSDGYDLPMKESPLAVKSVARKVGNKWLPLTLVDFETLQMAYTNGALPTLYAFDTTWDAENECTCSRVHLNSGTQCDIRIMTLDTIKEFKINDEIKLPTAYINLIESALCVATCKRYKLVDFIQMYEAEFDALAEDIKRINNANRPITQHNSCESFDRDYWNGYFGHGW